MSEFPHGHDMHPMTCDCEIRDFAREQWTRDRDLAVQAAVREQMEYFGGNVNPQVVATVVREEWASLDAGMRRKVAYHPEAT